MAQGIYDLLQETLKLTTNLNNQLCCNSNVTTTTTIVPTTTTTTAFIPPGGELLIILIGYQTISPVENIVYSNTLEDACIFLNNTLNNNINPESGIILDQTTYYYVSSNNTLYNVVTNSIAEDGYYFAVSIGIIFKVINGLVVQLIEDEAELFEICNTTTTTTVNP